MPMWDVLPAVTMSAQATILTGATVEVHGIVGNGWLYKNTNEIRFWQQSNALLQVEPFYSVAKQRAASQKRPLKVAKLFWWFNQGANVDISLTPKPHYGIDGNKIFGISGHSDHFAQLMEERLGKFPFHTFWGPKAGLPCTQWIAKAAAETLQTERPDLTMVYLPHLDYDPQRFGPSGCDMPKIVKELDDACEPLLDAAKKLGATVWVLSEYGHCDVTTPIYINKLLREKGYLVVRPGPFGEQLETFQSRAFAVVDHQLAHIYVKNPRDISAIKDLLRGLPGVDRLASGEERGDWQLNTPRAGDIVALAKRDAWFAYPFWLDEQFAPDYARSVAIHHKPGYDPAEMFFDPKLRFPMLRMVRKLIQKKLGFRTIFDVVPLDASIVRGSHGLIAADPQDGPLIIADGPKPTEPILPMTAVYQMVLEKLGVGEAT